MSESRNEENKIEIPSEVDTESVINKITTQNNFSLDATKKSLGLLQEGNTIPFIARYRKELTNGLNEVELRTIQKQYESNVNLEQRKITVLRLINDQEKLTIPLKERILKAINLQEVEDFYLPFKPKYKTLGAKAREKGLQPLADLIRKGDNQDPIEEVIKNYIDLDKGVETEKDAINGAIDIIAEESGSDPDSRQYVREIVFKRAILSTNVDEKLINNTDHDEKDREDEKEDKIIELGKKKVDPSTFTDYFNFNLQANQLHHHQILAISRAEDLDILSVEFDTPDEDLIQQIKKRVIGNQTKKTNKLIELYEKGIEAGFKRYIIRAIKREYWRDLRDKAEQHAIKVFATNLKNLLMTPPLKNRAIIGIDPGYRTGCKVAVIDKYGNFRDHSVIYPHPPKNLKGETEKILLNLAEKYAAYTFAIGNGTASRETEQFVIDFIKKHKSSSHEYAYAIVSEAGASIYSASEIAIEEFPNLDLTVRGAISIARRLQNPLSELIKIDPKSIGVGMYQHDVNQNELKAELDTVIEDCVNAVGVELNTASSKLLSYVSGLNMRLGKAIVEYRNENGPFTNRKELIKVKGLGTKSFEQCAGFLKIRDAKNPWDATFIHPESYELAEHILDEVNLNPQNLIHPETREKAIQTLLTIKPNQLARKFEIESNNVRSLVDQLLKPDLDPRDDLPAQILRQDVISLEDLKEGMVLKGTIRNVVDFGAFVDIGVKYNGLVHKSQIANQYVKNPHEFLSVGDVKDFKIIGIDRTRNRIQLTLKDVKQEN